MTQGRQKHSRVVSGFGTLSGPRRSALFSRSPGQLSRRARLPSKVARSKERREDMPHSRGKPIGGERETSARERDAQRLAHAQLDAGRTILRKRPRESPRCRCVARRTGSARPTRVCRFGCRALDRTTAELFGRTRTNRVRFTPAQVEAVRDGMNPGLTLVARRAVANLLPGAFLRCASGDQEGGRHRRRRRRSGRPGRGRRTSPCRSWPICSSTSQSSGRCLWLIRTPPSTTS